MKLIVNGIEHEIAASVLSDALERLDCRQRFFATALNGEFVPATQRATTRLTDGDRIEIVRPMQGG